ncbi:DHA2 family efflux MFS transporter permease subunit [Streptomyces bomunensis]|uniref:alpha-amylase n=1 Tax=Streptomyces montanisoli TaxID=2798581 RepID=A0A940RYB9_9ACTN|nr:DHA2 family efflux MFS transporter permease subunit [Streptomyces montanisoli]
MVVLDATIVNIALPSAQHDLGFDNNGRQWVITAYSLAFGSLLLLGGRLADLVGRKRMFIIGLIGFAGASALGGAADGFTMLVVARALQGMFGAVLAPSALSLLTTTFTDPKERSRAFGVFGAIAGSGGAIGLLLGGVLTEHLDWRWTLYVNDAIAVFAVLGAVFFIHGARPANRPKLDLLGTLLVAAGLFGVVFGFANAETHDWSEWMVWAFLAAGGVLLVLFTLWETRAKHPLLPLRVLADRNRASSYASVFISGAGMFGVFLFLTYYLEQTLKYSPIQTGVAFLPMIGVLMVMAQISTNLLIPRIGPKPVVPVGMGVAAAGLVWLTHLDLNSTYAAHVLPGLLLVGFGIGLVMPPAMSLATLGVAPRDQGVASATVNTMQQIGGSIGTALFNTIAATAAANYAKDHIGDQDVRVQSALHSYSSAYWWAAAFFAAGLIVSAIFYRKGRPAAFAQSEKATSEKATSEPPDDEAPAAGPSAQETGEPAGERTLASVAAVESAASAASAASAGQPAYHPAHHAKGTPTAAEAPGVLGHVLDAAGRPVSYASVTLIDSAGRQLARTGAGTDGAYVLADPGPGTYVVIASASGRQPHAVTISHHGTPVTTDLLLRGAGGLTGTVRSAGGTAVPGALVVAADERGDVVATATADDSGAYALPELTPGAYTLAVSAAGHQPGALPVELGDGSHALQDIELRPAAHIRGMVRNADGAPLPDTRLTLIDTAGNVLAHRVTDEDGAYAFADLPTGGYTVVANSYPPNATTFTLPSGMRRTQVDIELSHEPAPGDGYAPAPVAEAEAEPASGPAPAFAPAPAPTPTDGNGDGSASANGYRPAPSWANGNGNGYVDEVDGYGPEDRRPSAADEFQDRPAR